MLTKKIPCAEGFKTYNPDKVDALLMWVESAARALVAVVEVKEIPLVLSSARTVINNYNPIRQGREDPDLVSLFPVAIEENN